MLVPSVVNKGSADQDSDRRSSTHEAPRQTTLVGLPTVARIQKGCEFLLLQRRFPGASRHRTSSFYFYGLLMASSWVLVYLYASISLFMEGMPWR
jgi:hypothetical protein